ncbi:MAG TPA: PQQ-dependent sugar dehydrogenase [Thermoanaerobaculia bacterium]|nr:PQQ-dependent sugar dehydrogenase [Thermoanaerobaculia bacterium]
MKSALALLLTLTAVAASGATLPGFRVEKLGGTSGFSTSLVIDSRGNIDYTTQDGSLFRFENGTSTRLAGVTTEAISDSGLLGMALVDDNTAVVHYTTIGTTYDILSRIDLTTGAETVIHQFACDIEVPERGSSAEHHGGNPTIGADGSILVGIGDYAAGLIASLPQWNGGKIFRITPSGDVIQFSRGMRNPFDMIWDDKRQRVFVADNGATIGDALFAISEGANCGWPFSFGGRPPVDGVAQPVYDFAQTIAPTGMIALNGLNPQLRAGILLGGFVSKAIHFIPDIDANPFPDPIVLIDHETGPIIDIAQSARGDILFTTGSAIYRLIVPMRGDCNGDGRLSSSDLDAFQRELADAPEATYAAQAGSFAGSWGCDANGDGVIDERDRAEVVRLTGPRRRAVRSGH